MSTGFNPLSFTSTYAPPDDATAQPTTQANPAADLEAQNRQNYLQMLAARVNQPQQPQFNAMGQLQQQPAMPDPMAMAPRAGGLRGTMSRILYGMGQAGLRAAGMPDDFQLQQFALQRQATQAQIQQTQANTQNTILQGALLANRMRALQTMIGSGQDPFADMGPLNPDQRSLANSAIQEALATGSPEPITKAKSTISQQMEIWNRATRGAVPIDAQMAKDYNIPAPFIGKLIDANGLAFLKRGESYQWQLENTAQGPMLIPKYGENQGQARQVTLNGQPIMSNQQAGAYWQAKYGVVQSVDDAGNPVFARRLDAPGMPTSTGALQLMKGKAGLDNYKDALTRVSDNLDVMDDPTQRAIIARTMRSIGTVHDPGIIASYLGSAVSQGLSPRAADLTAAMLQAKEFIGANRQFTGNFTGSEALYNRMISNTPGPQNSAELNRALINQDLANTARIEQRMTAFQGGNRASKAAAPPSKPAQSTGGFDWGSIPGAVKR